VSRNWKSDSFTISEIRYGAGTQTPDHGNEEALIVFVETGGYAKKAGGEEFECDKHKVVFIPAQETQSDAFCSKETRCLVVDLNHSFVARFNETGAILKKAATFCGAEFSGYGLQLMREFRQRDSVSALIFEGLLLNILAIGIRSRWLDSKAQVPSWLSKAQDLLHDRFSESLSMAAIAAEVGVHPVSLSQGFRRFFKITPGEYLRRLRIEFAARQLRETNLPLSEIAAAAAFADQAHFARTFRQATNLTPLQFRKLTRY
jgi:AraC family transcriptional regulator